MECNEVTVLLDSLLDGELTESTQASLKSHVENCSSCAAELADMSKLQHELNSAACVTAPDRLLKNIQNKIDAEELLPSSFWLNIRSKLDVLIGSILNPAFTHAVAASLGAIFVFLIIQQPFNASSLHSNIFEAHINSLVDNNLIAVKSDDQHTVKPWFSGKVKFSPYVPDIKSSGFLLLGGRVDYLQDKKVAVLIYLRDKHKINVFISPKTSKSVTTEKWTHNGFNTVYWNDEVFTYAAISDLSHHDLKAFSLAFTSNN